MKIPPVAPPKTVLETILEWSQDRPDWQRDALRRIVAKGRLDEADIKELVVICKQGRGAKGIMLKPGFLAKSHLPANPGQGAAVSLISIADADGVNNLAPGQTLALEQHGLTIIYGDNGAGKSGYARVLKRACRARQTGKIEPNIYASSPPPAQASATITYSVVGTAQPPEKWQDAEHPHPVLSAVSVFDSDCGAVHISAKNEVAFRPFGLDIPDELAAVCQRVRDALAAEQRQLEKARNAIFAKPLWKDTTAVGKALAALKHDTDFKGIETLATLGKAERARHARLKEDLSKNPAKAAAELTLKADNIKRLVGALNQLEEKTDDAVLSGVAAKAKDARLKQDAARVAADKAFSGEALAGVGGEVWRVLWESARRYSTEVAYPGAPFPSVVADARCVLCQQPLDAAARARMARFEQFIREDTEQQARQAEQIATRAQRELAAVAIGTRSLKADLGESALQNPELARSARRFVAAARLRRYALMRSIRTGHDVALPLVPPNPAAELFEIEGNLRGHAAELHQSAEAEQRKKLEAEMAELADRQLLGGLIDTVRDEHERLKAIRFLEQCS